MSPIGMTILLAVTLGAFAYSATRRWQLMMVARRPENRADQIGKRLKAVLEFVFAQKRMVRYPLAGWAHIAVFFGFIVLLLNSILLWVRGYVTGGPACDLWILDVDQPLGAVYALLRDIFIVFVIIGVLIFYYNRVVARLKRLTLNFEGILILSIIFVMMIADLVYEGVEINAPLAEGGNAGHLRSAMPFASLTALLLAPLPVTAQRLLWQIGFWTHSALVLLFLNLLPYGKHFHVLTVIPNVFARHLTPRGRLAPIVDIDGKLEREETLGVKRLQDVSWKDVLDFYTCTECGRCSDQCPATNTGKLLSPKRFCVDLRDHLYRRQTELLGRGNGEKPADDEKELLIPATIKPEVLWACTTCAACEEECPVFITYIDKIVDQRRNLVMERGEFPEQLQTAFKGLETVANPYSYPNEQRAEWAAGLDVPLMAEKSDVEYVYWVGCAASFDDRSRKIARAFAQLLKTAGVSFAILGPEEQCNGDPARRAGNEYLFQMLARTNVETLNRYNVKKIVTTCPHCYNTLKNEYSDFGGHYELIHHSELLAGLVRTGRLVPRQRIEARVAYHDACYLGRHNEIYDPPRAVLAALPGVKLAEAVQSRDRGMCCGAGGAQAWKEEEAGHARVNHTRVRQLMSALPAGHKNCTIATACPFCKTMLSDGLADQGLQEVGQLDIAELLWQSVQGETAEVPTS
jgi:Fe-S oxidoreductase